VAARPSPDARAVRLAYRDGLPWPDLLDYLAARAIPGVERVEAPAYLRTVVVDGEPAVLELGPAGPSALRLRLHGTAAPAAAAAPRARRIANLDADVGAASAVLAADPLLVPLLRARRGLRPPGTWDPFETGVRAILGQQVSVAGASTLSGRLVARLGAPFEAARAHGLACAFPPPATVAEADLDGLGLTRARAAAVRGFAAAVADGAVMLERPVGLERLVESLVGLPGIGPWTAHYVALRLGEPDAFPDTDLGLRRAFAALRPASAGDLSAHAERWRPWRAHAAAQLWFAGAG
jgi:AraC family transcriptional regulator of adaptative response / DNA-3-methyladenine glycosylase II